MTKLRKKYKLQLKDNERLEDCIISCEAFSLDIYPNTICIGQSDKFKNEDILAFVHDTEEGAVYIIFNSKQKVTMSTLAHECYHIKECVDNYIGQNLYGEAGAYLIGALTDITYCYAHRNELI